MTELDIDWVYGVIVDQVGSRCGQIPDLHPRLLEGINEAARRLSVATIEEDF